MNRTILRGSVSALALAMAFGAAAQAQEFETVTSTGARASVANALEIKRNATQFGFKNYAPEPWHYSLTGG